MELRADILTLRTDDRDPQSGILRGRATLAKEGVYHYSDGVRTWAEYTPASTLNDKAWLDSLRLSPVTLNHPAQLVTADNAKSLAVGAIGDTILGMGDRIGAAITVWDRLAADAAQTTHREISLGYFAEIEQRAGIWNGIAYDSVQVKRRANHVALVDKGRHGPEVRASFDAADAPLAVVAVAEPGDLGEIMDAQTEIKTDDQTVTTTEVKTDDAITEVKIDAAAEKARADRAEADRDALRAQLDAMKSGDKCDNCGAPMKDGKYTKDALRAEVAARIDLERVARDHVKDYKADGKTDRQVRIDVLAGWNVTIADDRSDDYVAGRFEAELERRAGKKDAATIIADGLNAAAQTKPEPKIDANATMAGHWGVSR